MRCYQCGKKLEQKIVWNGGTGNVVVTEAHYDGKEVTMGADDALTGAKSYKKKLQLCGACKK